VIKDIVEYILKAGRTNVAFQKELERLLKWKEGDIGIVLSERIVNMPTAIIPPSYKMLLEEIQWATDDVLPFLEGLMIE
jgi:protein BCP1